MKKLLSIEILVNTLHKAGETHHEYEQNFLNGIRDEMWPGFYAAYVLGQLGDFIAPSKLSELLENAPSTDNWAQSASAYVIENLNTLSAQKMLES